MTRGPSALPTSLVLQLELDAAERIPYAHYGQAQTLPKLMYSSANSTRMYEYCTRTRTRVCGEMSRATATLDQQETNRSSSPCTCVCGMLDSKAKKVCTERVRAWIGREEK